MKSIFSIIYIPKPNGANAARYAGAATTTAIQICFVIKIQKPWEEHAPEQNH